MRPSRPIMVRVRHAGRRDDRHHHDPDPLRAMRKSVASGEHASTSDVLSDAPRLRQRQSEEQAERLNAIHALSAVRWTVRGPRSTRWRTIRKSCSPKRTKPRKMRGLRRPPGELQPDALGDLTDIFQVVWQANRKATTARVFVRRIRARPTGWWAPTCSTADGRLRTRISMFSSPDEGYPHP